VPKEVLIWVAENAPPARDHGHGDQGQTHRLLAHRAGASSNAGLSFCCTRFATQQASGVKGLIEFANAVQYAVMWDRISPRYAFPSSGKRAKQTSSPACAGEATR